MQCLPGGSGANGQVTRNANMKASARKNQETGIQGPQPRNARKGRPKKIPSAPSTSGSGMQMPGLETTLTPMIRNIKNCTATATSAAPGT